MTEPSTTASASIRAHAAVPFMNPMAEADVDAAIAALAPPSSVVETGCGAGALLLRVLAAHPEVVRAVGVDPDGEALARGRAAAMRQGASVEWIEARAEDAGLQSGGFDLVVNVASSHAHGGFPAALDALHALARPEGGVVLLGEGFWTRPPAEDFLAALGGATADELPLGLAGLLDAAGAAGFEVLDVREASAADWTAYEDGLAAEAERYDDADAAAYARRIRERRALPEGATTMGFALVTLRARRRAGP